MITERFFPKILMKASAISMNPVKAIMSHENKQKLLRNMQMQSARDGEAPDSQRLEGIMSVHNDCETILSAVKRCCPDILVLDLFIGSSDAMTLMEAIRRSMENHVPRFVVITEFPSLRMERQLYSAGAAMVMNKTGSPRLLCDLLLSDGGKDVLPYMPYHRNHADGQRDTVSVRYELAVTDIIHQIGIPAHIKGYQYVRFAIMTTVQYPDMMNAVTKRLYPCVAQRFDTTPSRVERAIRHAIEVAWDRGDIDVLNSYFGYTIHHGRGKPTNSEFIAMIADRLRLQPNIYR